MNQHDGLPEEIRAALDMVRQEEAEMDGLFDALQEQWDVKEQPFTSNVPLVGRLIVRLREAWNNVATRWYVQPILQQQIAFNSLVVQQMNHYHALLRDHKSRLAHLEVWLIDQEREAAHDDRLLAELSAQLGQINRALERVETQLDAMAAADEQRARGEQERR